MNLDFQLHFLNPMSEIFRFCYDIFSVDFILFGYTFSFFDLALACLLLALPFIILRNVEHI